MTAGRPNDRRVPLRAAGEKGDTPFSPDQT